MVIDKSANPWWINPEPVLSHCWLTYNWPGLYILTCSSPNSNIIQHLQIKLVSINKTRVKDTYAKLSKLIFYKRANFIFTVGPALVCIYTYIKAISDSCRRDNMAYLPWEWACALPLLRHRWFKYRPEMAYTLTIANMLTFEFVHKSK